MKNLLVTSAVNSPHVETGFMSIVGDLIVVVSGSFNLTSGAAEKVGPNLASAPNLQGKPASPPFDQPTAKWRECDPSRISVRDGVNISLYNQYVKGGVTCPLMGAWFDFDTFGHQLVISLDTEYQSAAASNDIVSYQVFAISSECKALEVIFFCDPGIRLSLSEIIDSTRRLLGIKPKTLAISKKKKSPASILLLSHFGAAEWAALRDRRKLGNVLQTIRKVPVSLGTVPFTVMMNNRLVETGLKVADTTLLAPAGKGSLAALGEVVGVPKMTLPDGAISRMREFHTEDPKTFAEYGVNDCLITYAYYVRMHGLATKTLGLSSMPLTLGGFGVAGYKLHVGQGPLLDFLGLERVSGYRKTTIEKTLAREVTDSFFGPAFSGGLNVAIAGEFSNTLVLDLDFRSCYPSAAATLPVLDWEATQTGIDLDGFSDEVSDMLDRHSATPIALAHVTFRFPDDCRWPCIPIRAGSRGLVYPLFGSAYATTFELVEALRKGAEIEVHRIEYLTPRLQDDGAPELMFADYLAQLIARRGEHPGGSLENLMFKEMANSFYGKLAQGVRRRSIRSFDNLSTLPESPITSPAHAGAVTGIVRAALVGLIDAIEECGGTVLAATTDGAMASFPHLADIARPVKLENITGFMDAALSKPGIRALAAGLSNMRITDSPIEIKHTGDRAIVWKTRGYIIYDGKDVQHVARAGHRGSADDLIAFDNDVSGTSRWELKRLSSVQSIWDGKQDDLVSIVEDRRVNLDYDYKRIPTPEGGFRPPKDIAEFEDWRERMENIRKRGEKADILKVRMGMSGINLQGGEIDALRRQLLRAIVQDLAGIYPRDDSGASVTQKELADRLGVSITDIKNAKRRSFVRLPRTKAAEAVFSEMLEILYPAEIDTGWPKLEEAVFSEI